MYHKSNKHELQIGQQFMKFRFYGEGGDFMVKEKKKQIYLLLELDIEVEIKIVAYWFV